MNDMKSKKDDFQNLPLNKVIKRLEILMNLIEIQEEEELFDAIEKLRQYDSYNDIKEIIEKIEDEDYSDAMNKIQSFISKNQLLSVWAEPEISGLKLEIRNLENYLAELEEEKADLEKVLTEFEHMHTVELGALILEILKLRKLKYKDVNQEKFEETVEDEEQYQKQFEQEVEKEIFKLSDEQKVELKKSFRKATLLCHPDKFVNEPIEVQRKAENIFKDLNEANAKNDIKRVSEILETLEKGELSTPEGDKLSDKDELKKTVELLGKKVKKLETEIVEIIESETYNTIINIKNLEEYFKTTKVKLQKELEQLENEIQ